MDIIPEHPRSVAQALAVAKECAPDHILIAWEQAGEDGVRSICLLAAADGDESLTAAEIVCLCEQIKMIQLDVHPRVGPVRPTKDT